MIDELVNLQHWLSSKIKDVFKAKRKQMGTTSHTQDSVDFHFENEPHISLTKVGVTLQFHWIQAFTNSLRKMFLPVKKFYLHFGKVQLFLNDAKTRIFIGKYR